MPSKEVLKIAGLKLTVDGAAQFQASLKNINSQMKLSSAELQKVTAQYGRNSTATGALAAKKQALQDKLKSQQQITKQLNNVLKETETRYGENSTEANTMRAKVLESEAAEERLKNQLKQVSIELTKQSDKAYLLGQKMQAAGAKMQAFGTKAQAAGKKISGIGNKLSIGLTLPLLYAGKQALQTASDLAEVQNVVDVTFGKNSETVNKWSKNLIDKFGLGELSAKKYAGVIGSMATSMGLTDDQALDMSMRLTELTGDFASFYNLDHETAFEKIRAGISGETEPLKQLGINLSVANLEAFALSEGITKSYNSMSEAEKATLRYNYIMDAGAKAQGDFARTSDSLANQTRIAQEEIKSLGADIAKEAIPVIKDILKQVNEWIKGFKNLSPETKRTILTVVALGAALGPVVRTVGSLTSAVGSLTKGFGKVLEKLGESRAKAAAAKLGLDGVAGATSGVGTAAGGATTATVGLSSAFLTAAGTAAIFVGAAVIIGTALDKGRAKSDEFAKSVSGAYERFAEEVANATAVTDTFISDTTASGAAVETVRDKINTVESQIVAAYKRYMADKGVERKKELANIKKFNEDLRELMLDEMSAYGTAQQVLADQLRLGTIEVTKENLAGVVKSIGEAEEQAKQAADDIYNEQARYVELNKDLTREQKDDQLEKLAKTRDEGVKIAKQMAADSAYYARLQLEDGNKNLTKQLDNISKYGDKMTKSYEDYAKERQEIQNKDYQFEGQRQKDLENLGYRYARQQDEIAGLISDAWSSVDEKTKDAWLSLINTEAAGGRKLDKDSRATVNAIIQNFATMENGLDKVGKAGMVALGRAIINEKSPKKAASATDKECIAEFKKRFGEYQDAGVEGINSVAKGMQTSSKSKTNRDKVLGAGTSLKNKFVSGFNGLGAQLKEKAEGGVNGFVSGILSRWAQNQVGNAAYKFGSWYTQSLAARLAENSPSKVTEKIAKYAVDGFVNRIYNEQKRIQRAGVAMANSYVGGLAGNVKSDASVGGSTNAPAVTTPTSAMNESAIRKIMREELSNATVEIDKRQIGRVVVLREA